MTEPEIHVGDKVIVLSAYGLRIEGVVQAIVDDHGTPMYRVASKDFALTVSRWQIAEVHK